MGRERTIFVIYTGDDWELKKPSTSPDLEHEYRTWQRVSKAFNVAFLRGSIQWFENGHFKKYWRMLPEGGWEKVDKPIKPTVVHDRTRLLDRRSGKPFYYVKPMRHQIAEVLPMVNLPEFSELVDNKLYQAMMFPKFMPPTSLLLPGTVFKNDTSGYAVIKQLEGSSGRQVMITKERDIKISRISIEQQFIQAKSNGHMKDLRIAFIGEEPQYALHRVAAKGSLYTNVTQGATVEFVNLKDIARILKVADEIIVPLMIFPKKIFTLDFLIDNKSRHPYLIETNTMPGTYRGFEQKLLENIMFNLTRHMFE